MKYKSQYSSLVRSVVLLAAVAIAVPAFAKPMTKNIPLIHDALVGKTDVKAGEYRFLIDGNHLTVMNGRKTVAEADGRWEDRDQKNQNTEILSGENGKVMEIRFEGQKSAFVLAQ
jgi:hypothetical protein